MGVDLTLLPLDYPIVTGSHGNHMATTVLDVARWRALWPFIETLPLVKLGEPLLTHLALDEAGNMEWGSVECDAYDGPLHYVRAADLVALREHPSIKDDFKNRAIWAYLAELPPDWPVVLYWD